jgi:diadenosine tetraphosphate (Ap4A) HIT family hydrolase
VLLQGHFNAECRFCTLPEPWRVIKQTKDFVVIMGLGPLTEGYVVIITRRHVSCCAAIVRENLSEFECLIRAVQDTQTRVYGASLFFEHGRSGACLPEGHGQDSCYHAHLNIFPTSFDLKAYVAADYSLQDLNNWQKVHDEYAVAEEPYILVQDADLISYVATPDKLPKRYLRTKLATMLGEPGLADWEAFPSYDLIRLGKSRIGSQLERSIEKQLKNLSRPVDVHKTSIRTKSDNYP